ncbi:MAG: insulinase family protein [Muribaculaceae bacterium]|nr:insulinase family protein [Muribaculaceae bacterium]
MKRLLLSMLLLLGIMGAKAQDNPEMPLNPDMLHGVLPNGLSYYILHNEEPKNRANFYIAQKVGSSLETPDQLGLAHFLEHMAFNGTTHYPGDAMLRYLESKGIRFGSDINAYTSFDETVYNINNVNTTDPALMDSVLLVLYDWSGSILLEEEEINKERGVIEGEYIQRNNANNRMFTALLPKLYEEYQYEQMPIGKMEIVKNFPPQVLRDYYKKWYRPDLQGIVIVGDFDAQLMEQKVQALFSTIEMPANASERVYPTISDNATPIYVTFEDPELQMPRIDSYFKFERTPREMRNTVMAYVVDNIVSQMVATMINNRLSEYAQKPECPYSYAGVSVGTFLVSDQKGAFNVTIIPKEGYLDAFTSAMGIIARACKTGFMGTEVQRVRDELLANYEKAFNEKDKTDSENLGREIIRHFIDNEPTPGVENEYRLASQVLPGLPEALFNEYASSLLHIENSAVVISQPTDLLDIPAENAMMQAMSDVISADYEPYVDEVITEPLISNMPKAGKIVSEKEESRLGTKEFTLSNGVRVVVKSTDYANDEIMLEMVKPGGKATYPSSEAANVQGMALALEVSKIGPFNPTRLGKYLAGKKVSLNYAVGNSSNFFEGRSTVKDVASLFELLYAAFTDVTADQETYDATLAQFRTILANQESNPEFIFQQKRNEVMYPESPAMYPLSLAVVNTMDYARILDLYHQSVKNAADYTLVLVGNIDVNTIKPLLEQYVASLPSTGVKTTPKAVTSVTPVDGKIDKTFDIPSQNPSVFLFECISQPGMEFNVKNQIMIDLLGEVIYSKFLETLREEMGGTYSPMAVANLNPYTSRWTINWYVVTNEEMMQPIIERANKEFETIMKNGTNEVTFAKVREAAIKQFENNERTNSFWTDALVLDVNGFDEVTGYRETLDTMTLADFNKFVTTLYNGQNKIEIVGVAK